MVKRVLQLIAVSVFVVYGVAHADLVTSDAGFVSPVVIDFSQFGGPNGQVTLGPVDVGTLVGVNVTFTSTNVDGSILGSGPYGLGDNGQWDANQTFAGLNVDLSGFDGYTMMFEFNSGPVAAVGGF